MKIFDWDGVLHTDFGNGSMAALLGIEIYGKHNKKWWHKAIVKPVWRVGNKFQAMKYWIMYRVSKEHKYHIIDTKLKPRYYDIDHVMLHGMFALLDRYIDGECGGIDKVEEWGKELVSSNTDHFMYKSSKRQGEKELGAAQLYRWWHETRPADLKRSGELLHLCYGRDSVESMFEDIEGTELQRYVPPKWDNIKLKLKQEYDDLEEKIEREEQEMLHRLIDIRKGLWT